MEKTDVLFGIETEYGISREYPDDKHDVVAESIALVRAAKEDGVRMRWDYACEDPHVDARGFRVDELRQDSDESNYFAQDASRPMSFSEIKSDLALKNGARFYNDHAHPEYCTPECATIADLLHQDALGDQLVMGCADSLTRETADSPEGRVLIYKNNTDFQGHSYGCHENYLIPRKLQWETLSTAMMAFLVTRQIFAGAGKFGWEKEDAYVQPGFQISQRADFFSVLESVDTMQRRPIINTRDEPHADPNYYRRFHVICGDANLSPYATYLKVGTTATVLQALSLGAPITELPQLQDPVGTIRSLSRDPDWRWRCTLANGKETTAVDLQRAYLAFVRKHLGELPNTLQLAHWEAILDDLETTPLRTSDRLDWSAKFQLIENFRRNENLDAGDPWIISLDLAYHQLDESEGLYFAIRNQGLMRPPFPLGSLRFTAPAGTRAAIRGRCLEKFGAQVEAAQWDHVRLRDEHGYLELDMRALFDPSAIDHALSVLDAAQSVRDLRVLPFAKLNN